jgi:hypothetical protein
MSGRRRERTLAITAAVVLALVAIAVIAYKAEALGWSPGTG